MIVMDQAKSKRKQLFFADAEKVFDQVDWTFMKWVLREDELWHKPVKMDQSYMLIRWP